MNSTLLAWTGPCVLVVAPVAVLRKVGASWRWFLFGILSWCLAVVAKTILTASFAATLMANASPWQQGLVYGALSALTELGAAALLLRRVELSLPNALAFGAGIGAFEVLFTVGLGLLEGLDAQPAPVLAERLAFIGGFFVWERVIAFCGHVASRLLIYLAVARRQWAPAVLTFVTFALIDGSASFGIASGWDWNSDQVMTRFLVFAGAVCLVEMAASCYFALRMPVWRGAVSPTARIP